MEKVILLADDDCDDYDIFKESLEASGCQASLFRAEDGATVFDFLKANDKPRPDLIFLDLNMPVMNGWQCLARLKNEPAYEGIPVVMYTTSSHFRDGEIATDLKAHGLITKPSNPRILTEVIKRIVCTLGTDDLYQAVKDAQLITQH
jgi:CheY-like chemotaxis protein